MAAEQVRYRRLWLYYWCRPFEIAKVGRTLFFDPAILYWSFLGAKFHRANSLPVESSLYGRRCITHATARRHHPRLVAVVMGR